MHGAILAKKTKKVSPKGRELIQKGNCGTCKDAKAQRKQLLGTLFFAKNIHEHTQNLLPS